MVYGKPPSAKPSGDIRILACRKRVFHPQRFLLATVGEKMDMFRICMATVVVDFPANIVDAVKREQALASHPVTVGRGNVETAQTGMVFRFRCVRILTGRRIVFLVVPVQDVQRVIQGVFIMQRVSLRRNGWRHANERRLPRNFVVFQQ